MAPQRGFTLVEVLITVTLMGLAVVAMAGFVFTMVGASDVDRRQALAEAELRRFSEAVRLSPYQECATPDPGSAYDPAPVGYSPLPQVQATVGGVAFWRFTSGAISVSDTGWYPSPASLNTISGGSDCNGPAGTDEGLQQITLTVTVAGLPAVTETATVVKRRLP